MVYKHKPPGDDTEEMKQFLKKHSETFALIFRNSWISTFSGWQFLTFFFFFFFIEDALNVNDNGIEQFQQEYSQLQEELNNSEDAAEEEYLQVSKQKLPANTGEMRRETFSSM